MRRSMTNHITSDLHYGGAFTATETPANGVDVSDAHSADILAFIGEAPNIANSPQPSWTLTLEHSDTVDSGFAAVADSDVVLERGGAITNGVFATVDAAVKENRIYRIGYVGIKKYIRIVATAENAPGSTVIVVSIEKLKRLLAPPV